jgi:uncharacterized protein involved in response to NO
MKMAPAASVRVGLAEAILREPYRPLFLLGAVYSFVAMALWFVWAEAFWSGRPLPIPWVVPPQRAHALALLWGVFTPYVLGFLLTAYVRWVGFRPPSRWALVTWSLSIAALPVLLVYGSLRSVVVARLALAGEAAVLLTVLAFLARALVVGREGARVQPAAVLVGLTAGLFALGLGAATLPDPASPLSRLSLLLGLYGFLLVLVFSVGYRLLPFFTARFLGRETPGPRATLVVSFVAGLATRLGLEVIDVAAVRPLGTALIDLLLVGLLGAALRRSAPRREAWRNPMLSVLYVAWLWLMAALCLSAAFALAGRSPSLLELPVLHAFTIGGVATMVLGLSTRISLGHANRPMVADGWIRLVFVLIQMAALLRVGLLLVAPVAPAARTWAHWAAVPWCLAFGIWLVRLGPLLLRPPEASAGALQIRPP